MRIWFRSGPPAALCAVALLLAACGAGSAPGPSSGAPATGVVVPASPGGPAPAAAVPAGLVSTPVSVPPGYGPPFDVPRSVLVPPGWHLSVWARLPDPRLAVWAPDGALLVSMPGNGEVMRLTPTPSGVADSTVLIGNLDQPHGLAFAGSTLYVAQSDEVDAYDYGSGGQVSAARPLLSGLPDQKSPDLHGAYAHALKSVAVGPDGSVYVSVGSTDNISPQDRTATPPRASILRVPPGGGPPQEFAAGVRNGTGLAIGPDGSVWTAVNERDDIAYPFATAYGTDGSAQGQVLPTYVRDHPAEAIARLFPGRDLGWPYCNPDPDTQPGALGSSLDYTDMKFDRDQQTNADGSQLDCSRLAPVEQGMGAHSAPLGLAFTTAPLPAGWGSGALIGAHGSWDRTPPQAPEVSFYPWVNGTLGSQRTLVGGFQAPDGSRWGRPVAALEGPDGAVYITDDEAGALYRLTPPGH